MSEFTVFSRRKFYGNEELTAAKGIESVERDGMAAERRRMKLGRWPNRCCC